MPANVEVALGGEAEFSVTAISNSPLTYQWRHNNKEMRGETASVLRLSNVQLSSAGAYSVIVKNEGGRVLSDAATLTVAQARPAALSAWAITQQPQSQSLVYGNGATFSVRLNDTIDVTYQWYKDGALLRGKTYPDLEVVPATPADAGVYKVVIKKGGATLVSNEAALRVENNGVAVYKLSITGRSITGAESRNEAYSGLLVLNTTKQEAGIIWLGQEGPTKTFSSEMRPGMKIRSSAPGIKGTTIVSEVVTESGEWVVWLTGANRVVKMYDEAAFVLPPTLKGTFNSTEPADLGDLTVKSLTATAILDLPTTLKFGYRAQSVRSILYQLETEFRWKEYVEKQPLAP
jgi:hypothetical protein